jgi:hypothetical protein
MTTDRLAQSVTVCHVLTGYTPVPQGHLPPAPERVSHVQMSAMTATALRRREGLNPWLVVSDTGATLTPDLAHSHATQVLVGEHFGRAVLVELGLDALHLRCPALAVEYDIRHSIPRFGVASGGSQYHDRTETRPDEPFKRAGGFKQYQFPIWRIH